MAVISSSFSAEFLGDYTTRSIQTPWGSAELDLAEVDGQRVACIWRYGLDHPLGLTPERALSDPVWAIGRDAVRHVIVAGQWVVRGGQLTQVDEERRRASVAADLYAG